MSVLELLLLILAILGGLDLSSRFIRVLAVAFPRILTLQFQFLTLLGGVISTPSLRRSATAARIDEVVNQTAFYLRNYLPSGWIRRAKISWVRKGSASTLADGTIILRIRPRSNTDDNLMEALWSYFRIALFPDSRDLIPETLISSIALAITRAAIQARHPYLISEFDNKFLKSLSQGEQGQMNSFADCVRLNEYGLLMGPFVRELDMAARQARFTSDRFIFQQTVDGILRHMLSFQPVARHNKPDADWTYSGPGSPYRFILVSRPPNIRSGADAYVHRAKKGLGEGTGRFYLIGRQDEREFFHKVTAATLSIRSLKGLDLFHLSNDYRGAPGGIGALLGTDEILLRLPLEDRTLGEIQHNGHSGAPGEHSSPGLAMMEVDRNLADVSFQVLDEMSHSPGQWVNLAPFGGELRQRIPDFDRRYGGRKLTSVLRSLDGIEIDEQGDGPGKVVFVRRVPLDEPGSEVLEGPAEPNRLEAVYEKIFSVLVNHRADGGWVFLGRLGHHIKSSFPGLDYGDLGFSSLFELISGVKGIDVVERDGMRNKTYVRYVSME